MNMNIDKSKKYFEEAQMYVPGRVNSPARAFKAAAGTSRFIEKADIKDTWECTARYFGV